MAETSTIIIPYLEIISGSGSVVNLIGYFNGARIYEDMHRNSWSGYVDINDSESFREDLPIIGEETIRMAFASIKSVDGDFDDFILLNDCKVTKLTDYQEVSSTRRTYRLHFHSKGAERNSMERVRKSYSGTASSIASTIITEQLEGTLVTVDGAKFDQKYVFPNLTPFQCINLMATSAISRRYNDPAYFFYEDRDGYHFTTLSKMFDKKPKYTIDTKIIKDRKDPNAELILALSTRHVPLFDVLENTDAGMYGDTLITYDKVNKRFDEITKTYTEAYPNFTHLGKEKLTRTKKESPKNKFQFMMINEPKSPGIYHNTTEWANQTMIRPPQVFGNRAMLGLNRPTDIKVGDVIDWPTMTTRDEPELDKILSGKWAVSRIRHDISSHSYSSTLEIIKDGMG